MPDFVNQNSEESWYDIRSDWLLIESSIAKQYGIRMRNENNMPWSEFCVLVAGLMPDTPLGKIVAIRSEKDPKILKSFNSDQRRVHREWRVNQAKKKLDNPKQLENDMKALQQAMKRMFYKPKKEVKKCLTNQEQV